MSERIDNSEDEALRRLLRSDAVEPDPVLDARILAAAREPAPSVAKRRWRYPVGLGAAASALLAIALLLQTPETAETVGGLAPERLQREALSDSDARDVIAQHPAFVTEQRPARLEPKQDSEDAAARKAGAATSAAPVRAMAMPRPTEKAVAPSAATDAVEPAAAHAELDQAVVGASVERRIATPPASADCSGAATAIEGAGLRLCIDDERIEVRDLSPVACREPLVLERIPGTVTLQSADGAVSIRIDDHTRWRVRCDAGAWRVETGS